MTVTVPVLGALDRVWAAVKRRHPEVPAVTFTISTVTAAERSAGHMATAVWRPGELSELAVAGEALADEPDDVLGVLLHMAAHGLAAVRGITDTSRQGRYHNARYAMLAHEVGLEPEPAGGMGFDHTWVPPMTASRYAGPLRSLAAAMTTEARAALAGADRSRAATTGRASSNNPLAALCGCPRRIRVSASVLAEGPIVCGVCRQEFTAV